MYFNWISTASFITLSTRGVKRVSTALLAIKLIQHRFIKSFVFRLGRINRSEKIKVVPIEHLKQKLSLDNN